jgi:HEAT repeat protein
MGQPCVAGSRRNLNGMEYYLLKHIDKLDSVVAADRDDALQMLLKMGENALPHITQALCWGTPRQRQGAAFLFGRISTEQAIDALLQALPEEHNQVVRTSQADALAAIGTPAFERIRRMLLSADTRERQHAIHVAQALDTPDFLPTLWSILHVIEYPLEYPVEYPLETENLIETSASVPDPMAECCVACILPIAATYAPDLDDAQERTLLRVGTAALRPLLNALASESEALHDFAAETLTRLGTPVIPALLVGLTRENICVRERSARVLARIGVPSLSPLLDLLDRNPATLSEAVQVCEQIGEAVLIPLLRAWPLSRPLLAQMIARQGDPMFQQVTALAQTDFDPDLRGRAREALQAAVKEMLATGWSQPFALRVVALLKCNALVREVAATTLLVELYALHNASYRVYVVKLLGAIDEGEAVEALMRCAEEDTDVAVREHAERALAAIQYTEEIAQDIRQIKNGDSEFQSAAARHLSTFSACAILPLIDLLSYSEPVYATDSIDTREVKKQRDNSIRQTARNTLEALDRQQPLPRMVVAEPRLSLAQRIDILNRLKTWNSLLHIGQFGYRRYTELRGVSAYCQFLCHDADLRVRRGAKAILSELDRRELGRAARPSTGLTAASELLRADEG